MEIQPFFGGIEIPRNSTNIGGIPPIFVEIVFHQIPRGGNSTIFGWDFDPLWVEKGGKTGLVGIPLFLVEIQLFGWKRVEKGVEKGGKRCGKGGKRVEIIGGNGSLGKGWKLRKYVPGIYQNWNIDDVHDIQHMIYFY